MPSVSLATAHLDAILACLQELPGKTCTGYLHAFLLEMGGRKPQYSVVRSISPRSRACRLHR